MALNTAINTAVNTVVNFSQEFSDSLYNMPASDKASLFVVLMNLIVLLLMFSICRR